MYYGVKAAESIRTAVVIIVKSLRIDLFSASNVHYAPPPPLPKQPG